MIRAVGWMTPLVAELQCFCQHHEEGDPGGAAAGMLEHLRCDWVDIPVVDLPVVAEDDRGAEELALVVVRDVGEVAAVLLSDEHPEDRLGWSRANLIVDLERYLAAAEGSRRT